MGDLRSAIAKARDAGTARKASTKPLPDSFSASRDAKRADFERVLRDALIQVAGNHARFAIVTVNPGFEEQVTEEYLKKEDLDFTKYQHALVSTAAYTNHVGGSKIEYLVQVEFDV